MIINTLKSTLKVHLLLFVKTTVNFESPFAYAALSELLDCNMTILMRKNHKDQLSPLILHLQQHDQELLSGQLLRDYRDGVRKYIASVRHLIDRSATHSGHLPPL